MTPRSCCGGNSSSRGIRAPFFSDPAMLGTCQRLHEWVFTPHLRRELLQVTRKHWSNFKYTGIKHCPRVLKIGRYGSLKPVSGMTVNRRISNGTQWHWKKSQIRKDKTTYLDTNPQVLYLEADKIIRKQTTKVTTIGNNVWEAAREQYKSQRNTMTQLCSLFNNHTGWWKSFPLQNFLLLMYQGEQQSLSCISHRTIFRIKEPVYMKVPRWLQNPSEMQCIAIFDIFISIFLPTIKIFIYLLLSSPCF